MKKNIDLVVCTGFRIHAVKRKHGGKKRIDMAEKMDENITHMLAGCDRNSLLIFLWGNVLFSKTEGRIALLAIMIVLLAMSVRNYLLYWNLD